METKTLNEITDKYIGKTGTPKRQKFEIEIRAGVIGELIKHTRLEQNMTQEQLGLLIGVQKSQISKIENNTKDVRFSTILRVFEALKARVNISVELPKNQQIRII